MKEVKELLVQYLGQEDTLEKEMVTHSVFLPENFHGQKSLAGYIQSKGSQGVRHDWAHICALTDIHTHTHKWWACNNKWEILFLTGTPHWGCKVRGHHHPEMHQGHCRRGKCQERRVPSSLVLGAWLPREIPFKLRSVEWNTVAGKGSKRWKVGEVFFKGPVMKRERVCQQREEVHYRSIKQKSSGTATLPEI